MTRPSRKGSTRGSTHTEFRCGNKTGLSNESPSLPHTWWIPTLQALGKEGPFKNGNTFYLFLFVVSGTLGFFLFFVPWFYCFILIFHLFFLCVSVNYIQFYFLLHFNESFPISHLFLLIFIFFIFQILLISFFSFPSILMLLLSFIKF